MDTIIVSQRGISRSQIKQTATILRDGKSVVWRGDTRRASFKRAVEIIRQAAPDARISVWPLDDKSGTRAVIWSLGEPEAFFTHLPVEPGN